MASFAATLSRFDIYSTNKTHDDLKVRTLGGAGISIVMSVFAVILLVTEFRSTFHLETVDKLDVDTSTSPDARLPVNIDIYLPSLPCSDLVMEVTDEAGTQQLSVTDKLHKLRMDRHGSPIDMPEKVEWGHVVAPAFQQRKVIRLMEEAQQHLEETLGHLDHEQEENPGLSDYEHEQHRSQLAEQAAQLHGRLTMLAGVAKEGDDDAEGAHRDEAHLEMSARELQRMHEEVEKSKVYTEAQREKVLANLHAMAKNVARLRNGTTSSTESNLREALRIRLSILSDNIHGFVSAQDIDRRDRYDSMKELLVDLGNQTALLPTELREHVGKSLADLETTLGQLMRGVKGERRKEVEKRFDETLAVVQAELKGEEVVPEGYCGSCYGAAQDGRCCNSCADLKAAYAERRWGFPAENHFEQCKREARMLQMMRAKYETAMKEKMLMKLERDRLASRVGGLEAQLRQIEGGGGMAEGEGTGGVGAGKTMVPKKPRGAALPPDSRDNPHLEREHPPSQVSRWGLSKTFQAHSASVSALAVHPTKPIVATASDDGLWKMWSLAGGELIMSGDGHKGWLSGIDFSPAGRQLATSAEDGTVKIWDFEKSRCVQTLVEHTQAVWGVSYMSDHPEFLASCSMDHTAKLWDLTTGRCRQTFRGHVDSINGVTFQPYANVVATASGDKTVSLWDCRTGLCAQTFYGHKNAVNSVGFKAQGDMLVSTDADGAVRVWDIRKVAEVCAVAASQHPCNAACFDLSGKAIAVACDDSLVRCYDPDDGSLLHTMAGHSDAVQCCAFGSTANNPSFLVTGGSDCTFRTWQ